MKTSTVYVLFAVTCAIHFAIVLSGRTSLTNVKCESFHPEFGVFSECRLKVIKRGLVALNIHFRVLQVPVTNAKAHLSIWKRANGYKPFLVNFTTDFCRGMRNDSRHAYFFVAKKFLYHDTNINHTCPYNHDLIVRNLTVDERLMRYFPMPNGDYMSLIRMGTNNQWMFEVKLYYNRKE